MPDYWISPSDLEGSCRKPVLLGVDSFQQGQSTECRDWPNLLHAYPLIRLHLQHDEYPTLSRIRSVNTG